jgi:DNA-binding transcriptional regulator YdaS (Cro superfamily)
MDITPARRIELADKLGISEQYLYQCLTGRKNMNPAEAVRIEAETRREITRQMLCQHTWRGIWPDLARRHDRRATKTKAEA